MSTDFLAEDVVSPELAAAMIRLAPANPFCTKSYAEAMRALGQQGWLLGTERGGELIAGCYGFLSSGHLNRSLEISSLPDIPCDDAFWDGLMRFCSLHGITYLQLENSFLSGRHIPPLPGEVERRDIRQYVLDLGDPGWERKVARKHRQNIKRALETGATLRRTAGADACREHVRLMAMSMERLRKRGEAVSGAGVERQWSLCFQFTQKRAGELFQAVAGSEVLSSAVVLRAAEGAYYESAGTSPEGMKCGASHFLLYSIARVLREESVRTFNLGNAEVPGDPGASNPGLELFKLRFGATPVSVESATFYLGSNLRRRLTAAAHSLRQSGSALLRRIGAVGRGLQLSASVLDPCSAADRVLALWPPCNRAQHHRLESRERGRV
jgi:hypothetical protein